MCVCHACDRGCTCFNNSPCIACLSDWLGPSWSQFGWENPKAVVLVCMGAPVQLVGGGVHSAQGLRVCDALVCMLGKREHTKFRECERQLKAARRARSFSAVHREGDAGRNVAALTPHGHFVACFSTRHRLVCDKLNLIFSSYSKNKQANKQTNKTKLNQTKNK